METKLTQSFEDYLREQFSDGYTGTSDDAPDRFDDWLGDIVGDFDDYGEYAEAYAKSEVELAREAWRLADGKAD